MKAASAAADLRVSCQRQRVCSPPFLPRRPHGERVPGGAGGSGGQALMGLASAQNPLFKEIWRERIKGRWIFSLPSNC